jgi:diaminopimelate decarboxylase/aspartate kinase
MLFTPNFAPRSEYERALRAGVRTTLDSLHPLQHWPELFRGQEIMLRLDPGHGRGHHDKVVTGGSTSKFGLSLSDVGEFKRLARGMGLRITGIHAHLGSGILEATHFRETYAEMASLAEQFPDCARINIGGGLGVPSRPDEHPLDLEGVGRALAEVKALYPQYRLWMEPGRFLVAEAGVLLSTVTQVKRKGEYFYVGVDTGMNSLIRPALYDAYHEIVNLTRLGDRPDTVCEVVGPICETGDVLGNHRRLPMPREGDVLLIATTGAYGSVMSSHYNLREPAPESAL